MMKKSHYSIYNEEIDELVNQPKGYMDHLFKKAFRKLSNSVDLKYTFTIPAADYLRGELFCSDVSEAMEEEFTQKHLIGILLDDLLFQAKKRSNPYELYNALNAMDRQFIQISSYSENNNMDTLKTNVKKPIKMECKIKRKQALRLEVMLSDIEELEPARVFTVEDVLQIIYCDFIYRYKNGSLKNVLESIIQRLK